METIARFGIWLIQRIPLRTLRKVGRLGGLATYHLAGRRRRIALDNLDLAYGETLSREEKIAIAKSSFINLVTTGLEFCYSPAIRCPIDKLVKVENPELFERVYAQGKGVIVLVPHMGNWEVCGRWHGEHGAVQHAVVRRQRTEWVGRIVSEIRRSNRIREIDKKGGLKKVLTAIRRGEMVSMLIDQRAIKDAVEVQFFGHPARTHASVAMLAMRTGCPVMVCAGYRHPDGSFGGVFSEPIETIDTGNREQDLIDNTQRYVSEIEKYVRKYPQDWMWMHQRWRSARKRETRSEQHGTLPVK